MSPRRGRLASCRGERPLARLRASLGGSTAWLLGAALLLHLALLLHFFPLSVLGSRQAVINIDYSLHFYQASRAAEAFRRWGRLWSYDPFLLAGQPAGTVEDLTSKSLELFVLAAQGLGVSIARAFNAYLFVAQLLVPLVGYAAARLLGLRGSRAVLGVALWVALWFFDSFLHWCWYVGMISWAVASYLAVLVVALMLRAMDRRRGRDFALLGAAAALLTLVHPFGVLSVALPLALTYLRDLRLLAARHHVMLWLGAAAAAATTLVWLGPAWRFRHYIGDVDAFLRPGPRQLLYDWLEVMPDVLMTGEPVLTTLRFACFAAAGLQLRRWARQGDRRTLPLASMVLSCLAVAYLSGGLWAARQTQPYRQLGPALLAAALPAAEYCADLCSRATLKGLRPAVRTLLALGGLLALPQVAHTVLHYVPEALPTANYDPRLVWAVAPEALRARRDRGPYPYAERPSEELRRVHLGLYLPPESYTDVRATLEREHAGRGRIVVMDWVLGEYLAATTQLPILGGIPQRYVPHVDAHFERHRHDRLPERVDRMAHFLELYAVGTFVTFGEMGPLDGRRDLLELRSVSADYRVYRVRREPSYFQQGQGRVTAQGLNHIAVETTSPGTAVLRFHWLENLRCRPGCRVERVAVDGDRAGFLRVPDAPRRFEIIGVYD